MATQQEQVDLNYQEFLKELPSIIKAHKDEYALMQDGKILSFYTTIEDAKTTGKKFLAGQLFSIQRVTDVPIDLGYFSHAINIVQV